MIDLKRLNDDSIKRWHKRGHYDYQKQITYAILDAIIASKKGETIEIPIELPRQSGKTTGVVDTVEFILSACNRYLKFAPSIGIFAPEVEQATTDFDRLKMQFNEIANLGFSTKALTKKDVKFPEKWNSKTIRLFSRQNYLGEVYIFPISKTSNPESKTLDLIIIEEAQLINDEKMKKSVFPMGASTNAPRIYVGTAGTKICYFKRQLENNPKAIKIKLADVFNQRHKRFENDKNENHLLYKNYVEHEIAFHGEDSDYIQTQYKGKWLIGSGQLTTAEQLDKMIGKHGIIEKETELNTYVGIDTAKSPDSTIVTVLRDKKDDLNKSELCNWLELKGDNYEDQFDIIKNWLRPYETIKNIAIDATGQADFMPDKFERHTGYNIIRFKFTAESKDVLYKILLQVIKNVLTLLPNVPLSSSYMAFRQQLLDMEKEYKGRFLSCHHPDGKDMHDDFPDSWALAEYAKTEYIKKSPRLSFM